jgi:hypothetical protein
VWIQKRNLKYNKRNCLKIYQTLKTYPLQINKYHILMKKLLFCLLLHRIQNHRKRRLHRLPHIYLLNNPPKFINQKYLLKKNKILPQRKMNTCLHKWKCHKIRKPTKNSEIYQILKKITHSHRNPSTKILKLNTNILRTTLSLHSFQILN